MAWLKVLGFNFSRRFVSKDQREQGGTAQEEFEKRWFLDSNVPDNIFVIYHSLSCKRIPSSPAKQIERRVFKACSSKSISNLSGTAAWQTPL